ncbi:hypothetical protein Tco_0019655 [Tanacetum coccineum]
MAGVVARTDASCQNLYKTVIEISCDKATSRKYFVTRLSRDVKHTLAEIVESFRSLDPFFSYRMSPEQVHLSFLIKIGDPTHDCLLSLTNKIEIVRSESGSMATKGKLVEVVTTCERSWVQASPWGFPSGAKKEWGLSPKTKVQVLHTT